jgi:hypothetical protein
VSALDGLTLDAVIELVAERRTARASIVDTDGWLRVVCAETGESVDLRNLHPGHVLRALAQLSEACSCGARWHFEETERAA